MVSTVRWTSSCVRFSSAIRQASNGLVGFALHTEIPYIRVI